MAIRYPFSPIPWGKGETFPMPVLPFGLRFNDNPIIQVHGLLDTGATVNVLPHSLGIRMGAKWENQTTSITLTGNLSRLEARAILVEGHITDWPPVKLVFAWIRDDPCLLILGRVIFFQEFDVTFRRKHFQLEIEPAKA